MSAAALPSHLFINLILSNPNPHTTSKRIFHKMSGEFVALTRNYEAEEQLSARPRKDCLNHPLLNDQERKQVEQINIDNNDDDNREEKNNGGSGESKNSQQINAPEREGMTLIDPLSDPFSMMLGGGDFDPLGAMGGAPFAPSDPLSPPPPPSTSSTTSSSSSSPSSSATSSTSSSSAGGAAGSTGESAFQLRWNDFKNDVLLHYNVAGKFRVKTNFMTDVDETENLDKKKLPTDSAKKRLEKLEETKEEAAASVEVTQKDFVRRIEALHKELISSWKRNERVQTLKIAIQCAKLMQDTTVISFYPSAFMMLTSVLDSFGQLVYTRILAQAQDLARTGGMVPIVDGKFTCSDVPQPAQEICRNWFYKTACIRELVPRLYVEMALMKCYIFLGDGVYQRVVKRTVGITRGIGDTLVAGWARVYLSKIAAQLLPEDITHLQHCFNDYMFTWSQVKRIVDPDALDPNDPLTPLHAHKLPSGLPPVHEKFLKSRNIEHDEYTRLHRPAFGWLASELGRRASQETFTTTITHYRDDCGDGVALKAILDGFDPNLWAKSASGVMKLIKAAGVNDVTLTDLVGSLGRGLLICPPPEKQRVGVLNECWKIVTKDSDLPKYATCCSIWVQLTLEHYQEKHVQTLLKDFVKHIRLAETLGQSDQLELIVKDLEVVVDCITASSLDGFGGVITSSYFMQLLDLFKSDKKTLLLKDLLTNFTRTGSTSDPVIIHTVFDIARQLHDSLDYLSPDDERRQIGTLLCTFVGQIDFGNDVEQQLKVLVDCRAAFPNLDQVKDRLVLAVSQLAAKAHRLMKGNLTRKTAAFVKACLAYCHITIPSIDDVFKRLQLFQLCGQLSLINGFLPQTDTFFKAAISIVPDIPEFFIDKQTRSRTPTEPMLLPCLKSFLSSMVVVPGHPEHGPFYLVKGLLKAADKYSWKEGKGNKIELYLALLPTLNAYTQRKLPYTIVNVQSNDILFGGNARYISEVNEMMKTVIHSIMEQLGALGKLAKGNATMEKRMRELVIEFINVLIASVEVEKHVSLVKKLLKLCVGSEHSSFFKLTVSHMRKRAAETEMEATRRGGQAAMRQRDALFDIVSVIPVGRPGVP